MAERFPKEARDIIDEALRLADGGESEEAGE
jgi:hypothetical protein